MSRGGGFLSYSFLIPPTFSLPPYLLDPPSMARKVPYIFRSPPPPFLHTHKHTHSHTHTRTQAHTHTHTQTHTHTHTHTITHTHDITQSHTIYIFWERGPNIRNGECVLACKCTKSHHDIWHKIIVYILLRCKTICVRSWRWLTPQRHNFALGIPTCWHLRMLKFALPPTPNIKFAFPSTQNPNASQWNIGCVDSSMQTFRFGYVHFNFFDVNLISVGSRFSVKYGLKSTNF